MQQTLTPRRITARRLAVGGLGLGAAAVAAIATASPASAASAVSVSPSSGLAPSATVTVSGSGFTPNARLYLAECDTTATLGTACNQASYKVVTTNSAGAFAATTLTVTKSFTGWNGATGQNGATVNCKGASGHQCAVQTSNASNGVLDIATGNIVFS